MSNRAWATVYALSAAVCAEIGGVTHDPAWCGAVVLGALAAVQCIAQQICDAIKTGKDTA